MIHIYHNPRCSKSREGVAILEQSNQPFEVIKYLQTPFTKESLTKLIEKLEIAPIELIRTNEAIWKEQFKEKSIPNSELIEAMITYPKLIERPIIEKGNKAIIGRPTELIKDFIK